MKRGYFTLHFDAPVQSRQVIRYAVKVRTQSVSDELISLGTYAAGEIPNYLKRTYEGVGNKLFIDITYVRRPCFSELVDTYIRRYAGVERVII